MLRHMGTPRPGLPIAAQKRTPQEAERNGGRHEAAPGERLTAHRAPRCVVTRRAEAPTLRRRVRLTMPSSGHPIPATAVCRHRSGLPTAPYATLSIVDLVRQIIVTRLWYVPRGMYPRRTTTDEPLPLPAPRAVVTGPNGERNVSGDIDDFLNYFALIDGQDCALNFDLFIWTPDDDGVGPGMILGTPITPGQVIYRETKCGGVGTSGVRSGGGLTPGGHPAPVVPGRLTVPLQR